MIALLLAVVACGSDEEAPPPGRGIGGPEPASAASPRAVPMREARRGPERPALRIEPGFMAPAAEPTMEPRPETPPEAEQPTMEPPPPDREAELRRLVGDPSSCIGRIENPPAELSIHVAATVTTTGVVTRYEVSNPHLSEEAIDCIGNRLANARFAGPVEEAPRTIRATVIVRWQPPEATMTEMTGG